jgi:hypothetical protein
MTLLPTTGATGDSTLVTVQIVEGTPASPPYTVMVDASQVNAGTVQLYDDGPAGGHGDAVAGDLVFTNSVTIAPGTSNGAKQLISTVTDSAAPTQSSTCSAALTVNTVALAATGAANPNALLPGNPTLLTVNVTPATGPVSTGIAVTEDLSSIGGSSTQQFYDDGTHGDAVAGDSVYSYSYAIPGATPLGAYSLPFTVSDAQFRSVNGSVDLTLGYCVVSTANNAICTTTYEFISNVTLGSINDTEPCSVPSYQNQTAQSTVMAPGESDPFSVTIGSYWGADEVTAYVDWNNNGTLDDPGEAFVVTTGGGVGSGAGSATYSTNITAPADAAPGSHLMRVWLTYNITPTPCLTGQTFGQIKDYTIMVGGGSTGSCCTNNTCRVTSQADCTNGTWTAGGTCTGPSSCNGGHFCGSADFNCDGDIGTDADINAFFECLSGTCPALPCISSADFNGDGDIGTDQDIDAFFRVLSGAGC